ncbi:hypothetical protein [Streptomyces mobaraensis]|uniref:Uncharacterized protein n=1 Tax=Streptomyces mobaraensis TaxID=35621 RepID=A0A5N5W1X9_STRMB|nr:hypothetical protein [Streptomyces mobaraensis]KAB7835791.1 hypothetical protein FRZ00_26640 [Streptomyces mobaraensis]
MAEPDNVARLIAAGSALAAVSNMAVSYAAYRRKHPRISFKAEEWGVSDQEGNRWPAFRVTLANRGEGAIKVEDISYEFRWHEQPRTLTNRFIGRRQYHGSGVHGLGVPVWEDLGIPLELGSFEHAQITLVFANCTRVLLEKEWLVGRVRVLLSGGRTLAGRWLTPDPRQYECPCEVCRQQGMQLSFDDLAAQS